MAIKLRTGLVATAVFAMAGMGLAACGSSDAASTATSAATSAATSMASSASSSASTMASSAASDAGSDLFGPACADYAKANPTGAGSVAGMAALPLSQAASANPLLKTLVSAVSGKLNPKVDLVNTLDGGQFTVFAPADSAFEKIPAATIDTLKTEAGAKTLSDILTYHVVPTQIAPSKIDGAQKTVEGQSLTVSGTGNDRMVTDASGKSAKILCGGIKTQNATVYLIDSVLMPKPAAAATTAAATMNPAADLFGPACADYAKANPTGAGSVAGMAALPLSQAASANPLVKTLVAAVSGKLNPKVNLVDTLDGGQFTVFAPADTAFAKLPAATVETLKTEAGAATLSKVLTYHVVPTQIAPDKIAGAHKTVEGGELTVNGTGNDRTVTDASGNTAKILCGGIKTQNATVYLIDSVLMPK